MMALLKFLFSPAYTIDRVIEKSAIEWCDRDVYTVDFGCGECSLAEFFNVKELYLGIDVEDRRIDKSSDTNHLIYDGEKIPLSQNSVDQ